MSLCYFRPTEWDCITKDISNRSPIRPFYRILPTLGVQYCTLY